jgi:HEAT repeat protein
MRKFISCLILLALLPIGSLSAAADETYFAFGAEQIETGGDKQYAFVPFAFKGPRETSLERKVALIFERIHQPRAALYGDTYLIIKGNSAAQSEAYLTLDPSAERFHQIIVGEFFLTLSNMGITKLHVSPWDRWVTDNDVIYPYFTPMVPVWEALPPAHYSHSVLRLSDGQLINSEEFYDRLAKGEKGIYDNIFATLSGELVYPKMKVLEAFPNLKINDPAAHLIPLLGDKHKEIKYKAIEMLSKYGSPKVLTALGALANSDPDPEARLMSARILVAAGKSDFKIYIMFEKLKSDDKTVLIKTLNKLGASGDKRVIPALLQMLAHKDKDVQTASFQNLDKLKDTETLKQLLITEGVDAAYKEGAARTLMASQDKATAMVGLTFLLKAGPKQAIMDAVDVIQMRGYTELAPDLAKLTEEKDVDLATKAIEAIEALKLADQLGAIAKASERSELTERSRTAISNIYKSMPLKAVLSATTNETLVIRELAYAAAVPFTKDKKQRTKVINALFAGLKDKEVIVRRAAASALFGTEDAAVSQRLLKASDDDDPQVRGVVVDAARSLKNEKGDNVILTLIDDPDDKVKLAVVKAIGERGLKQAMPKLKFRVNNRDLEMRRAVLATIVTLNETEEEHTEFMNVYQTAIFDVDTEIKLSGLEGIQWISDPNIVTILQDGTLTFHKDPRVRAQTLLGLGRSRDHNTIESIARGLDDKDAMVKEAAIKALKILGHKNGAVPLEEFLKVSDDKNLVPLAKEALEAIKNPSKGLLD